MSPLHEILVQALQADLDRAWVAVCMHYAFAESGDLGAAAIDLAEAERAFDVFGVAFAAPSHPKLPRLHGDALRLGQLAPRLLGEGEPLTAAEKDEVEAISNQFALLKPSA